MTVVCGVLHTGFERQPTKVATRAPKHKCLVTDLAALTADAAGELDVLGHDGDPLGVDGAEVGVLEERDEVGLGGFLQSTEVLKNIWVFC